MATFHFALLLNNSQSISGKTLKKGDKLWERDFQKYLLSIHGSWSDPIFFIDIFFKANQNAEYILRKNQVV